MVQISPVPIRLGAASTACVLTGDLDLMRLLRFGAKLGGLIMAKKILFFFLVGYIFLGRAWAGEITLPEVPGWQATPADFLHYRGSFGRAFYIARTFTKEGATIQLFLAGGPEGEKFQHLLSDRLEMETKDYFLKYFQEGPFRCLISHSRPEKKGFMAVFLNDKPVVILFARYTGLTDQEIRTWLKSLDWESLKQQALTALKN